MKFGESRLDKTESQWYTERGTVQYSTVQYSTVQYSTVLRRTENSIRIHDVVIVISPFKFNLTDDCIVW